MKSSANPAFQAVQAHILYLLIMSKKGLTQRRIFTYVFQPLLYSEDWSFEPLKKMTATQGNPSGIFPGMRAQRRRESWALELPRGVFSGNLRPDSPEYADDVARDALIATVKRQTGKAGFTGRDMIRVDGVWYYREPAIKTFSEYNGDKLLFLAALRFLHAATKDPSLIRGQQARVAVPLDKRPIVNGHRARGPAWTPAEDALLGVYFGRRNCGNCKHCFDYKKEVVRARVKRHHALSKEEWAWILEHKFNNTRTVLSVCARLAELNRQVKRELMPNGILPAELRATYADRFLGEKLRYPKKAPTPEPESRRRRRIERELKKATAALSLRG